MKSIFNDDIVSDRNLNPTHAKIITIEGIDGSGKTTLIEHCTEELKNRGYSVSQFHTSSDFNNFWSVVNNGVKSGTINRDINQMFHNVAFLTYLKTLFVDELNNNDFVIGDWYVYGKMLLSDLYTKKSHSLSKKIITDQIFLGNILIPEFSFFLDVPPEIALQRIKKRNTITEEKESLEMLRTAYELWQQYLKTYDICSLNGLLSVEDLTTEVIKRVLKS